MKDMIEREMVLKASIETVWDAITNPEKLSVWFGDKADIPVFAEGESIIFGWGESICRGIIETIDEPTVFAFRWQSSRLGKNAAFKKDYSTLVTFTLTSIPTGTHLHMIETGFASLPEEIIETEAVSKPTIHVAKLPVDTEQPLSMLTNPVQSTEEDAQLLIGSADINLKHSVQAYEDNVSGWTHEFDDLKAFLEQEK